VWQVAAGRRTCEDVAHAMAFVHRGKQAEHILVVAAPENDLRQVGRKEGLLRVACSQQHLPICMQHGLVRAEVSSLRLVVPVHRARALTKPDQNQNAGSRECGWLTGQHPGTSARHRCHSAGQLAGSSSLTLNSLSTSMISHAASPEEPSAVPFIAPCCALKLACTFPVPFIITAAAQEAVPGIDVCLIACEGPAASLSRVRPAVWAEMEARGPLESPLPLAPVPGARCGTHNPSGTPCCLLGAWGHPVS
jgi:hypothetical protein